METQQITVDRKEARDLYRKYKEHQHWSQPIDHEVRRVYQLIAQGRMVIRALDSIRTAGLNDEGLPKLAIVRADSPSCWLEFDRDALIFRNRERARSWRHNSKSAANGSTERVEWPGIRQPAGQRWRYEAITPLVPIHLRPKRGLANYRILFEAEWHRRIPVDPMLLRRIGKGDMWLVLAAWDLTPVEQAALQARLSS